MTEGLVLILIILDAVLLVFLAIMFRLWRRLPKGPDGSRVFQATEDFLAASEELVARFDKNLKDKRALSAEILQALEVKIVDLKALLDRAEALERSLDQKISDNPPTLSDKEMSVLRFHRQGLNPAQIATRTRLSRGEIEMILSIHGKS